MRNKFFSIALLILVTLGAFTGTALASSAALGEGDSMLDLLRPAIDAFAGGSYALGASLMLVLAVAAARRYGAARFPFLAGDAGGSLLVLLGAFGAALAATLGTGAALTGGMAWVACKLAVVTAGGFSLVKRLVVDPLLRPLAARAPSWAQPVFALVFWFFDRPSPVARAEAAGKAAVKASPGKGIKGVVGKPRNVK